jgi:indoleamine 2,3-dioxygenase
MSTIAKVFDIDQQTGFMASDPPLERLPHCWEAWETVLDVAFESKLQVGDKLGLTDEERVTSKRWRDRVRAVRILHSTYISFLRQPQLWPHSCLRYPLMAC